MSTPKLNNTSFKYITWSKLSNLLKQCCNGGGGGGGQNVWDLLQHGYIF